MVTIPPNLAGHQLPFRVSEMDLWVNRRFLRTYSLAESSLFAENMNKETGAKKNQRKQGMQAKIRLGSHHPAQCFGSVSPWFHWLKKFKGHLSNPALWLAWHITVAPLSSFWEGSHTSLQNSAEPWEFSRKLSGSGMLDGHKRFFVPPWSVASVRLAFTSPGALQGCLGLSKMLTAPPIGCGSKSVFTQSPVCTPPPACN